MAGTQSHVRSAADLLDQAATAWAVIVMIASALIAYALRHSGVLIWAPVLVVGAATGWLVYTAANLAARAAIDGAANRDG